MAAAVEVAEPAGVDSIEISDVSGMTDSDWKKKLSPQEYRVLRKKSTDPPSDTVGYCAPEYKSLKKGYFACRGCGNPLYDYKAKFDSGCGWPAFDKCYKGSIKTETDETYGMVRLEIMCSKCDGHLGHLFAGEGFGHRRIARSEQRHCVNSSSVVYVKSKPPEGFSETIMVLRKERDDL